MGGTGEGAKQLDERLVAAISRRFFIIDIRDEGDTWGAWKEIRLMGRLHMNDI